MLIIPYVCAEFRDRNGNRIHRITPDMIGLFIDAPEAIRQDLLFQMLLADGSIKTPEDAKKNRNLENDPMKGAGADGKEIVPEREAESAVKQTRTAKSGKTETKAAEAEQKK